MDRRTALKSIVGTAAAGIAGCTGDGTGGSATPTEQPTTTPPHPGDDIEYLVRNDDDTSHRVVVQLTNDDGTVVAEQRDAELTPGEQLGGSAFGLDPADGPFSISISLQSLSTSIEWDPGACVRFDLLVAITADGQLEVEREACIK